ncbi:hypothetical protein MSPP1_003985 [Malassezia sp. CBS 17886]|nr:hypothetical protein MSPP1_003985 [Malassezia sp. CBS 17886]
MKGSIAAWGYYDDDRFLDIFITSHDRTTVTVHTWMHDAFAFNSTPAAELVLPADLRVANVVPVDMNYDGRLDVLVYAEPSRRGGNDAITPVLWASRRDGTLAAPQRLPAAMHAQPLTLDATGDLHVDLLGHAETQADTLSVWRNTMGTNATAPVAIEAPRLMRANGTDAPPACRLADPHSSAFIDLNGDCLADLFLVCEGPSAAQRAYQIWTARAQEPMTYDLAGTGLLPRGAGALSFADMNRDGTIDVVFPSCEGGVCYVNIAYNKQMPLCAPEREITLGGWVPRPSNGTAARAERCRGALHLCEADDELRLDFRVGSPLLARIPVAQLTGDARVLLADELAPTTAPVPLRLGDQNKDGYPDMLLISVPASSRAGETRVHLLENAACAPGAPGCAAPAHDTLTRRTLRRATHTVLDVYAHVRSAAFVDLDEDVRVVRRRADAQGTLDIVLQSLAPGQPHTSGARELAFIQDNHFHDAFFLKTHTLNAACDGRCEPGDGVAPYAAWGSGLGGASYKFTVLDPNGVRRAQQGASPQRQLTAVAQQPQTAYGAMLPPSSLFGLGRTNNYVESLFVGSTRRQAQPFLVMEGVMPNSEVVVIPWQGAPTPAPTPDLWRRELFLHPGDWIHLVVIALAGVIALLAVVVFALDLHEKREDERERKRAVHAINFDAL